MEVEALRSERDDAIDSFLISVAVTAFILSQPRRRKADDVACKKKKKEGKSFLELVNHFLPAVTETNKYSANDKKKQSTFFLQRARWL